MATTALIVGAGSGLSASLARLFAKEGFTVALAARQIEKLTQLSSEIGAVSFAADASKPDEVAIPLPIYEGLTPVETG